MSTILTDIFDDLSELGDLIMNKQANIKKPTTTTILLRKTLLYIRSLEKRVSNRCVKLEFNKYLFEKMMGKMGNFYAKSVFD